MYIENINLLHLIALDNGYIDESFLERIYHKF